MPNYVSELGVGNSVYPIKDREGRTIANEAKQIAEEAKEIAERGGGAGVPPTRVAYYNYRFAVSVEGSDEFDGSPEHPFRTLDKFFNVCQELNKVRDKDDPSSEEETQVRVDIRCDILKHGEYHVKSFSVSDVAIHIKALEPNTLIRFVGNGEDPVAFYNVHLNMEGGSQKIGDETMNAYFLNVSGDFYIDGGSGAFRDCNLDCRFRSYGGGSFFERCNLTHILFIDANLKINNCVFIGKTTEHPIVELHAGTLYMYGERNYIESSVAGCTCIYAKGSHVGVGSSVHELGGHERFSAVLRLEASTCTGARSSMLSLRTFGPNYIDRGSTISNNLLWYNDGNGANDLQLNDEAVLYERITNYNAIVLRVRGSATVIGEGGHGYIDIILGTNYNEFPPYFPVGFVDTEGTHTANVWIRGDDFTIVSSNGGFRVGAIYGINI